jgi:hypothetical protein
MNRRHRIKGKKHAVVNMRIVCSVHRLNIFKSREAFFNPDVMSDDGTLLAHTVDGFCNRIAAW